MRRAGISLQVRLRTADFNDGNFEEVRTTLNASRKSIYFFTTLDRYYKGMRLRVSSPYDPMAGVANLEQVGEVVRVQRRNDGYGVAVALSTCRQSTPVNAPAPRAYVPPAEPATRESRSQSQSERRCASRSPFVAPVELVDMRTGSRIPARTSDLSMQGCCIDTLNPLPIGAAVRAQIHRFLFSSRQSYPQLIPRMPQAICSSAHHVFGARTRLARLCHPSLRNHCSKV
jgi:hypothetical protein